MIKFGNKDNPFDPSELPEELAYTRKFFSKKPNDHIVQLLEFLSSNYKSGLNKAEVDKLHSFYEYKIILGNITAIYNNYKYYLVDNYSVDNLKILFDLKAESSVLYLIDPNESWFFPVLPFQIALKDN